MSRSCAARLSVYAAIAALASGFPLAAQAPANTPPPAPPAASQPGRPPAPDAVRLREAMKPFLPAFELRHRQILRATGALLVLRD